MYFSLGFVILHHRVPNVSVYTRLDHNLFLELHTETRPAVFPFCFTTLLGLSTRIVQMKTRTVDVASLKSENDNFLVALEENPCDHKVIRIHICTKFHGKPIKRC